MSDLDDTRIKVLRKKMRYQPVEGSPGYWIDRSTGQRFHYRDFVVQPEWCEFLCPECFAPVVLRRGDPRLGGDRDMFHETTFRCAGCGTEAPLGTFRMSAYVDVDGEACATYAPSKSTHPGYRRNANAR